MPRPTEDPREIERRWFDTVAARNAIRVSVRALIILDDRLLLQRMRHPGSYWFFPGGEVELGEQLETALRRELAEETTIAVRRMVYRFTANNRFERDGRRFHFIEHYFEVTPDRSRIESLEAPFMLDWLPLTDLRGLDIRPWGVRDIMAVSGWRTIRLLEVE
jgi:ADP-ribose pyrophosphatase YjhB (NUDIX family)